MTPAAVTTQVASANGVFSPAKIQVNAVHTEYLNSLGSGSPTLSREILGADLELDLLSMAEYGELAKWNRAGSDLTVYYVQRMKPGVYYGQSFGLENNPVYGSLGASIVVANGAPDRTLPHETGHILGLGHPSEEPFDQHEVDPADYPNNLMTPSIDGMSTGLSDLQIERLRQGFYRF